MVQLALFMHKKGDENTHRKSVLSAYDLVGTLIVSITIFSILFAFFFRIVGVDGSSMLPTLNDGDMLILSLTEDNYRRGDIIVVDRYTDEPLIKRVIAVGGETVSIDSNGKVYVDDKPLNETYIQGKTDLKDFSGEMTIPRGYLFVMGDNRSVSKDSRSAEIGLISVDDVVGTAVYCVWPISSVGNV